MTVLLIRPMTPSSSHSGMVSVQYPINLGYLASYLKEKNIPCIVKDFEVETYTSEAFVSFIKANRPSLIGFSCMTPHIVHGGELAGVVKEYFPDILTVVGGVHASAIPEQTLIEFHQFDVVVRGEGELTLHELYLTWLNKDGLKDVKGIAYRDKSTNKVVLTTTRPMVDNIDKMPFPDRDLVDTEKYKRSHVSRGFSRKTMNIAEITCSRGCPYDCIFCASKVVHSRKVRFRSADNIIAEMEYLRKKYNIDHFSFLDDTFTIRRQLVRQICDYLRENKLTFDIFTRVNDIDEDKINTIVLSGCKKISFGIESGSPKILKLLKKGITINQIEKAYDIVRKAGPMIIESTFMVGSHPEETLEDIEMTRKLIYKLQPDIMGIFITIPYPGTEINKILKQRGLLVNENWEEFKLFFSKPSWELGKIPMVELEKISKNIFYGYYFRPLFMLKILWESKSFNELKCLFEGGISLLKAKYQV